MPDLDDVLDENKDNRDNFDDRGFVLNDNISLDELNNLEPSFFPNMIKFVVDKDTNRVAIGMKIHKTAEIFFGSNHGNLYGGNIFKDGHIVYESTLNINKNLENWKEKHKHSLFKKNAPFPDNPRIIVDKDIQDIINATLFDWVDLRR